MKKITIVITALMLFSISCQDYLEQDVRSVENFDNYFQSEDDLITFSNGMFASLIIWTWEGGGLFFNNFWIHIKFIKMRKKKASLENMEYTFW